MADALARVQTEGMRMSEILNKASALRLSRMSREFSEDVASALEKEKESLRIDRMHSQMPVLDETLIRAAQTRLGIDPTQSSLCNVVIIGLSGAGKSTMINALRGVRPTEASAAKVGITETTRTVQAYDVPSIPGLKIWDAPGCNTLDNPLFHPADPTLNYYQRYEIFAFTGVLVLYGSRQSESAAYLMRTCFAGKQHVALIRTKADADVQDQQEDGLAESEQHAIANVRHAFTREGIETLGALHGKVKRFLISMRDYTNGKNRFDEEKLIGFLKELVEEHKQRVLTSSSLRPSSARSNSVHHTTFAKRKVMLDQ